MLAPRRIRGMAARWALRLAHATREQIIAHFFSSNHELSDASHEEVVADLAVRCVDDYSIARKADYFLSLIHPLPEELVSGVLMDTDLLLHLFGSLRITCRPPAVCSVWRDAWLQNLRKRRLPLREVPCVQPSLSVEGMFGARAGEVRRGAATARQGMASGANSYHEGRQEGRQEAGGGAGARGADGGALVG